MKHNIWFDEKIGAVRMKMIGEVTPDDCQDRNGRDGSDEKHPLLQERSRSSGVVAREGVIGK